MKLSIITINYNNKEGLRKTMESVFAQTYRDFEYIVVDGESTDGSVDVIKEIEKSQISNHKSKISFSWLTEKDSGIYEAMNKGIEIVSGKRIVNTFNRSELVEDKHGEADRPEGTRAENMGKNDGYVLMLNSGDYLVDEHVIEKIMPKLDGTDIIQGNIITIEKKVRVIKSGYGKSDISFIDVMGGQFLHQASFCRMTLFEQYGYFDESYRINGDTVFYAKCLAFGNASFKYVNQDIAFYDNTGISADPNGKWRQVRKEEDIRYRSMYSSRMQLLLTEEKKKIILYNKLHAHKWSWYLTMVIANLVNLINKD